MSRKYWEEMGFSTEWYYWHYRMKMEKLPTEKIQWMIERWGDVARAELKAAARSWVFCQQHYTKVLLEIEAQAQAQAPVEQEQRSLFDFVRRAG